MPVVNVAVTVSAPPAMFFAKKVCALQPDAQVVRAAAGAYVLPFESVTVTASVLSQTTYATTRFPWVVVCGRATALDTPELICLEVPWTNAGGPVFCAVNVAV